MTRKKGFTILSLFDGISCGMIALKRAGIPITSYYASEIEDASIRIAKHNFPKIIEIGDVRNISYAQGVLHTDCGSFEIGDVDILIGGSPCTDFSSIGYAKGMVSGKVEITTLEQYLELKKEGVEFEGQSYLFWEYIRILHEVKPRYYFLENVVMAKRWQMVIDRALGHSPLMINSSLFSAQNRPRLYWTNFAPQDICPPDMGVTLDGILDPTASNSDVSSCKTVQRAMPSLISKYGSIPERFNAYNSTKLKDKACALSRGSMVTSSCATLLFVKVKNGVHRVSSGIMNKRFPCDMKDGRYNLRRLSILEMERLQTLPDDYTLVPGVGAQKRSAAIGNGWTVDVIAYLFSFIKL